MARLAFLTLAAFFALVRPAYAGDTAAAEALFAEAKKLAASGDYSAACPKFEESQRLDAGMGTLYNLADCFAKVRRYASAWAAFRDVAAQARAAGQPAREADARARAAALEPKLSRLTIVVRGGGPQGLEVRRDGVPLGKASWGLAVPVDIGEHAIVVSAPGKKTAEARIAVKHEAQSVTFEVPPLTDLPAELVPPPRSSMPIGNAPARGQPSEEETRTEEDRTRERRTRRTIALALGAVGLAGLGTGTVFGLVSLSKHNDADQHCDGAICRDQEGVDLRSDSRSAGNVSTAAFAIGVAGIAAAAYLWFTAPSSTASAPSTSRVQLTPYAGMGLAGATAVGRF